MNGTEQLSLEDITFLRAIRDINGSPDRYASTEQGETPATVTAITEATTLSEEEVRYRLTHPRLGRSDLLNVYDVGPPGDDSASLDSAELTEAGERAIAAADDPDSDDTSDQRDGAQFDEMEQWEPVDAVEGDTTPTDSSGSGGAAYAVQSGAEPRATPRAERFSRPPAATESAPADDRLAALESRIDDLEAEQTESEQAGQEESDDAAPERVDDLASEVASLRETTDRLAGRLDDAIAELNAIQESEYGAIDAKRERQFETAVKSMVAFHQLATKVLDVEVENYEPAAGRADAERVAITRERIGDALDIGTQTASDDISLSSEGNWPDPEEAASGGRVFGDDDGDDAADGESVDELQPESKAPDTGVYPPIGGNEDAEDEGDESVEADEPVEPDPASDAPETGLYPPIGENRETGSESESTADDAGQPESAAPDTGVYPPIGGSEDGDGGDDNSDDEPAGSLPASMRPGSDDVGVTETASEEGHVIDAIRSTDDAPADPRLDIDAGRLDAVRTAISEARAAADDPYPAGEAYARIVGEAPVGDGSEAASERSRAAVDADTGIDGIDD